LATDSTLFERGKSQALLQVPSGYKKALFDEHGLKQNLATCSSLFERGKAHELEHNPSGYKKALLEGQGLKQSFMVD